MAANYSGLGVLAIIALPFLTRQIAVTSPFLLLRQPLTVLQIFLPSRDRNETTSSHPIYQHLESVASDTTALFPLFAIALCLSNITTLPRCQAPPHHSSRLCADCLSLFIVLLLGLQIVAVVSCFCKSKIGGWTRRGCWWGAVWIMLGVVLRASGRMDGERSAYV
jgi:hypothetical protein